MHRISTTAAAVLAAAGLCVTGAVGVADASPVATHTSNGVSKGDVTFLKSNEQVNLAEITLAKITLKRSVGHKARSLARETMKDHLRTMAANKKVAKADGITLPTAPNAMQTAAAKELASASKVALTYFKIQVAGHKLSIKQTEAEIANGSSKNITAYAHDTYLPVAKHHLMMSQADLKHFRSTH